MAVSSLLAMAWLDVTMISGGVLALGGLGLMPYQRKRLGEAVKGKGREMEERLKAVMKVEVDGEVERVERRVRRGMEGIGREVEREGARLKVARSELQQLQAQWKEVMQAVEALQPNRAAQEQA